MAVPVRNRYGARTFFDTALRNAVSEKSTDAVAALLKKKPSDTQYESGCQSAFRLAVSDGSTEIVRLFLAEGANVNSVYDHNPTDTVLAKAECYGFKEIADLLKEAGALSPEAAIELGEQLWAAVERGPENIEAIRELLEMGANPDYTGYTHDTSVIKLAVMSGHIEVVRLLLENGADTNTGLRTGEVTVLHLALESKRADIVLALLASSANNMNINVALERFQAVKLDSHMEGRRHWLQRWEVSHSMCSTQSVSYVRPSREARAILFSHPLHEYEPIIELLRRYCCGYAGG